MSMFVTVENLDVTGGRSEEKGDGTENQAAKMRFELKFAPIKDNPLMSNLNRAGQVFVSGDKSFGDTMAAWAIGLYYPGGLRELSRVQQAQEGVYGRRAKGMFDEDAGSFGERAAQIFEAMKDQVKKRTPALKKDDVYLNPGFNQSQLPAKAIKKD